jgi:ADP-ribose pyrophosphatase
MKNKTLFEKPLKREKIFSGNAVNFRADTVRLPDGGTATREFMDHPGAVAILPVMENGDIILVRQYRYPVGQATLEIPAGKLHFGKDPLIGRARAELREETGYTAASFKRIMSFWPTPAFSSELLHIFVAGGLKAGKPSPDEDEFIRTERMPFARAYGLVRTGRIRDAKTILALQAYKIRCIEA